ncbi:hypothetical protein KW782_00990 [Candidatus Parcubacteria bacterium]|nr:hypothetical protein [Candidatus Parcubacteria bacterium]
MTRSETEDFRHDKVNEMRAKIAAGTAEMPFKLDQALNRLTAELMDESEEELG